MRIKKIRKRAWPRIYKLSKQCEEALIEGEWVEVIILMFDAVNYKYSAEDRDYEETFLTVELVDNILKLSREVGEVIDAGDPDHWHAYPAHIIFKRLYQSMDTREGHAFLRSIPWDQMVELRRMITMIYRAQWARCWGHNLTNSPMEQE